MADRRHGTVFIAYDLTTGVFGGYWDAEPPGPPAVLHQLTPDDDIRGLIAWGRERSKRIVVRMPDDVHYWAGDNRCPKDAVPWNDDLPEQMGRPIVESANWPEIVGSCPCGWRFTSRDGMTPALDAVAAHAAARTHSSTAG